MGIGLQGIAMGVRQGLQDYRDNMRSIEDTQRREKMDARDDERFKLEKAKAEEEMGRVAARKKYTDTLAQIQSDVNSGAGDFAKAGFIEQPQQAIQTQDGQPAQSTNNPFKMSGSGMYRNQQMADRMVMERKSAALESLYADLGEHEKAAMVPYTMEHMFNNHIEEKAKVALSHAALGTPGAMEAISKVYSYFNDGQEIDPKSGTWDDKTKSWKGVNFVDTATGQKTTRDITQQDILAMTKHDAASMAQFNIERSDKAIDQGLKTRQVAADETRAAAAVTSANADTVRAKAIADRSAADASGANQRALVDAVTKEFPLANKEYKPEDLLLEKDKGAAKIANQQLQNKQWQKTLDIAGLNPRVDVRTISSLVRSGKVQAQLDQDGRTFTQVGTTRVYLN